jgi:hypothetical protein
MMNNNSLSWASYCSSASDFLPIEEFGAACFAELLLKFCCFQLNIEADRNALRALLSDSIFGRKQHKIRRRQQKHAASASTID